MTLHLDAVARTYGGLQALAPLHLDIPVGSRHAIIGPNGAGKTTLLNLIAGTLRPTGGRIRLDGTDITALNPPRRARAGISRTHQHPAVYPRLTVAQHLTLATPARRKPATAARGAQALDSVGLTPHLHTPAAALSYGQKRLLELAVALTAGPRVLLLDEPSAGLADADIARLQAVIREMPADVTVLLVDHHLDLVWDVADHVTVLHQGRHLTTATPQDVRDDPQVRAAYLGSDTPRRSGRVHQAGRQLMTAQLPRLGYDGAPVLTDVDLTIGQGETRAVLGANGTGKTTLLNALAGLHPAPAATITVDGRPLEARHPRDVLRAGVVLVPQGRRLWSRLTVAEHLAVAAAGSPTRGRTTPGVLDVFPQLAARLRHRSDHLSGGEQQMLAIARALLATPRLLLLDEPVEGLAPAVIADLTAVLAARADNGLALLIAEPHPVLSASMAAVLHTITNRTLLEGAGMQHFRTSHSASEANLSQGNRRGR